MKKKKTAAKKTAKKTSIVDALWLNDRFDKLENDHKVIVRLLKGGNVSPELEKAINRTSVISLRIDRKVPDQ